MSFEKVTVPISTSESQIFPIGCCSSNFNTGDYDPEFAGGIATHKEITQVFNDIQRARQPFVRKRWLFEFLMFWVYLIVALAVLFLRVIIFGIENTVGWIIMFVILGICSVFINEFYDQKLSDFVKESKDVCYKMIDEQYKASFEAKGLRWFLPTHFPSWIELQKIHGDGSQNIAQPIYIPPNQHQQLDANDMNAQV